MISGHPLGNNYRILNTKNNRRQSIKQNIQFEFFSQPCNRCFNRWFLPQNMLCPESSTKQSIKSPVFSGVMSVIISISPLFIFVLREVFSPALPKIQRLSFLFIQIINIFDHNREFLCFQCFVTNSGFQYFEVAPIQDCLLPRAVLLRLLLGRVLGAALVLRLHLIHFQSRINNKIAYVIRTCVFALLLFLHRIFRMSTPFS